MDALDEQGARVIIGRRRVRARLGAAQVLARAGVAARVGERLVRLRGLHAHDPIELGHRVFGALAGSGVLASSTQGARTLAALPLGAFIGARAGLAMHERGGRAAEREARAALPAALDRMTTCVLAGMSVERALRVVAHDSRGALGAAFNEGIRALDLGLPRVRAYAVISERAGIDEVRVLMSALARAERFGSSLSETLVAQAREVRSRARAAAEQEARTAPVKLIFPLVFCFLPAFVLLTIAPIAISAVRTLSGI